VPERLLPLPHLGRAGGASRCSRSRQRLSVAGLMFISLQISEAGLPPSCYWTARIRASFGCCL
jgi:hypothetical protein